MATDLELRVEAIEERLERLERWVEGISRGIETLAGMAENYLQAELDGLATRREEAG